MTREPIARPLLVTVLVTLLMALTTGCTGADDEPSATGPEPDRATIHDGLARLFAGDHATDQDLTDGDCFAKELVVRATPAQLRDAGVLDPSYAVVESLPPLPHAMAEAWADAQQACVDFVEASSRAQVKVTHGEIDVDAYVACLRRAMSPEQLREVQVATLEGDFEADALGTFSTFQSACARIAMPG